MKRGTVRDERQQTRFGDIINKVEKNVCVDSGDPEETHGGVNEEVENGAACCTG